jgi:hypothetical protein
MGSGGWEGLANAFKKIVQRGEQLVPSFNAWMELVSVLVQSAEKRYPQKGRGRLKKEQVKTAIRYLLRADKFKIPDIPDSLKPFVIDAVVDWSIDVLVCITNENSLWDKGESVRWSLRATISAALLWIADITRPVWVWIVKICAWIWEMLEQGTALTPELRRALDDAVDKKLVQNKRESFGDVLGAVVWMADHREQVTAAFQLVSEAVHEAELLLNKTGPEKRAYARNLVLATLDALGIRVGDGLLSAILGGIVNILIDGVVNLFNKFPTDNPAFKHKGKSSSSRSRGTGNRSLESG